MQENLSDQMRFFLREREMESRWEQELKQQTDALRQAATPRGLFASCRNLGCEFVMFVSARHRFTTSVSSLGQSP